MERETINNLQQQIQFQMSLINLVQHGMEESSVQRGVVSDSAVQRMAEFAQIAAR